jgi:hypothetical protein
MPNNNSYTLDDFAETLIKDKQYTTITPGTYDELKLDILQRVHDYLLAKTIEKLTDDQAKELNELLKTQPSDEKIQGFIASAIPDSVSFIGDTLFQFRQIYLGLA